MLKEAQSLVTGLLAEDSRADISKQNLPASDFSCIHLLLVYTQRVNRHTSKYTTPSLLLDRRSMRWLEGFYIRTWDASVVLTMAEALKHLLLLLITTAAPPGMGMRVPYSFLPLCEYNSSGTNLDLSNQGHLAKSRP